MPGIADDIKRHFQEGDALTRLILVQIAVYVVYLILNILSTLFQAPIAESVVEFVALPSDLLRLATRPWTLFTYMFLHQGFFHIFFNLLWLYFGGRLFIDYFGGRRLWSVFLIGGLIGGVLYVIFYNVFPAFEEAVAISNNRGASAGVMALIIAIATYNPRFPVKLFFVVTVPLWGIAVGFVLLDLIGLGDGQNAGGRIAHLGGAAFGYFMATQYQQGKDLTEGFSSLMDQVVSAVQGFFQPEPKLKTVHRSNQARGQKSKRSSSSTRPSSSSKAYSQRDMDAILDKISKSGYDSLSKEEKDILFKIGKDQ